LGPTDVVVFASTSVPGVDTDTPIFRRWQAWSVDPADSSMRRQAGLSLGSHNYPRVGKLQQRRVLPAPPNATVRRLRFYQTLWGVIHRNMPTTIAMGMLEATVAGRYADKRDFREVGTVLSVMLKVNLLALVPLIAWLAVSGPQIVPAGESTWSVGPALSFHRPDSGRTLAVGDRSFKSMSRSRSCIVRRCGILSLLFLWRSASFFSLISVCCLSSDSYNSPPAMLLLKAPVIRLPIRGVTVGRRFLAGASGAHGDLALIQHGLLSVIFSGACVLACFFLAAYVSKYLKRTNCCSKALP
jgi:hypothetical protein